MTVPIPPQFASYVLTSWSKYCLVMASGTPVQKTMARNILYIWLNQCSQVLGQPTVPSTEYVDPPVAPRIQTEDGSDYGVATGNLEYPG